MIKETNLLFHYTSLDVLNHLFTEYSDKHPYLTFWATNCAYMNDPRETSEGIDLIKDALMDISCPILKERARVLIENENIKDAMIIGSAITAQGVPYAISFSKNKDNLNMWRMYGNSGRGIGLGFKNDKIKAEDCSLDECLYIHKENRESVINMTKRALEIMLLKLGSAPKGLSQQQYDFVRSLEIIGLISSRIKNIVYSYEREIRLIKNCKQPKYRVANNVLIPYTTIEVPVEALESIVVGPDCDERNINSLRLFFLSKGLNRIAESIETSQVPFRN